MTPDPAAALALVPVLLWALPVALALGLAALLATLRR